MTTSPEPTTPNPESVGPVLILLHEGVQGNGKTYRKGDSIYLPDSFETPGWTEEERKDPKIKVTIRSIVTVDNETKFGLTVTSATGKKIEGDISVYDPHFKLGKDLFFLDGKKSDSKPTVTPAPTPVTPKPAPIATPDATPVLSKSSVSSIEGLTLDENLSFEENEQKILAEIAALEDEIQRFSDEIVDITKELSVADQFELERETRREMLKNMRAGLNRIVIHGGKPKYKPSANDKILNKIIAENEGQEELKEGEYYDIIQPDHDVEGALWMMRLFEKVTGEQFFKEGSGAVIESVPKGSQKLMPVREGEENIMYIDVGQQNFSIKKGSKLTENFLDHHNTRKSHPTSATQMMMHVLCEEPKFYDYVKGNPWIFKFGDFMTSFDNLTYLKDDFDVDELKKEWPRSLYGMMHGSKETLPLEAVAEAFEKGRDPWRPYTGMEIKDGITYTNLLGEEEKIDLQKNVTAGLYQVKSNLQAIDNAEYAMEAMKLPKETPELGKFLFHNHPQYINEDGNEKTNVIANNMGFITAKARGYDTYIVYNPQNQSFFINSSTIDLKPVYEKLKAKYPGTTLVRGVMIFTPKNKEVTKNMTEAEFLQTIGLK